MKKFISLVLALVMALSLTTVAWGAGNTITVGTSGDKATLAEAIDIAVDGDTIQLLENVDLGTTGVIVSKKLILDLGAFTITAAINDNYGAVYVGMAGNLTINATTGGITNTAGHAIGNFGVVVVNGGTFTGDYALYNFYYNATTFGTATINGGTFQASAGTLAVANCGELTVDGGSIESLDSSAVLEVTDGTIEELLVTEPDYAPPVTETKISDGTVESLTVEAAVEDSIEISGGTFTDDVTTYLAPGLELTDGGVVVPAGGAAVTAKSYKMTSDGNLVPGDVNAIYAPAVAAVLNSDGKQTNTANIAHYDFNGADYVVAASLSDADVVLYSDAAGKNVMMYLKEAVVSYAGTGAAYANFGKACGQVTYTAEAGKTYYITNANGDTGIYVADAKGTKALMYGGQLITVNATPVADLTAAVKHAAVPTVKDGKIVGYTCATCKLAAVEAPNFMSIPKGAAVVTGNWYWPVATAGTTTGGTVTSADTFDAGIAMYIGMSVMAAAGSAVVIGKKKD